MRVALLLRITVIFLLPIGEASADEPIEYKLAVIDAGSYVSKDHITVARFRSLLHQLTSKFIEDRAKIADMTVKAQQLLREQGINEKMLGIMEGINRLFPRRFPNQQYGEYVAVYVTARIQGLSHNEALGGLQAFLEALGVR
jgi:hypothetical protein